MRVSAVVVSRMDFRIGEIIDTILPHVEDLIVVRGHNGVWERWEACSRAKCDVVYVQDDDAVVDVGAVLAQYEPGVVTCNMPQDRRAEYQDGIALVGWGCVFDRGMACWGSYRDSPFNRYFKAQKQDWLFIRECDRVFTGLAKLKLIDVPFRHFPHAFAPDRMGQESRHASDLQEIRRRIYAIRAAH